MGPVTVTVDAGPTLAAVGDDDVAGTTRPWHLQADTIAPAVSDVVIMTVTLTHVLLTRRLAPPFAGLWALPPAADLPRVLAAGNVTATDVAACHDLGEIRSRTWDPRVAGVRADAACYLVNRNPEPDGTGDVSGPVGDVAWLPLPDVAAGRVVLAFEHARWLARVTGPSGPSPDPELHAAFTLLAVAAEVRSSTLITKSNAVRLAAGAAPIDVNWRRLSQLQQTLSASTGPDTGPA